MQRLKWTGENQGFRIGVIRKFHAAHWLNDYEGKCANIHGHEWKIECVIKGERLNKHGFVIDFGIVKKALGEILSEFDHKVINFIVPQSTAENIAIYIYDKMYRWLRDYSVKKVGIRYFLEKIVVHETEDNFFEYISKESTYDEWFNIKKSIMADQTSKRAKEMWEVDRDNQIKKIKKGISDDAKKRCSDRMIKNNPMAIRSNVEKMMKSLRQSLRVRPNKPEKELMDIFERNNIKFDYVGDLSYLIDGKNPDFINIENNQIIELFGEFWHSDNNPWYETSNDEKSRVEFFRERGWKCLVIWDSELEDEEGIIDKIQIWQKSK